MDEPPFNPGAQLYCMVLKNPETREVTVGSLGTIRWPEGWTYYVGRAQYGWSSRLQRFTRPDQSLHWHVDYLVADPEIDLTYLLLFDELADGECDLAEWFANLDETEPLHEAFGASDCRAKCPAHAFSMEESPETIQPRLTASPFEWTGMVRFQEQASIWYPTS